jgi:hypothetical protein
MDYIHFEIGDEYRLATAAIITRGKTPFIAHKPGWITRILRVGV